MQLLPQEAAALRRLTWPLRIQWASMPRRASGSASKCRARSWRLAWPRCFDGRVGAFAYLLFILLYFPCVATIGVIVRETGGAWATFVAAWTTGVAYTSATLFYQIATFERHPTSSLAWVIALGLILVAAIAGLRIWAGRGRTQRLAPAEAEA